MGGVRSGTTGPGFCGEIWLNPGRPKAKIRESENANGPLTGYLKAVWPDVFWVGVWGLGGPWENVGGVAPHLFGWF